MLELPPVVWTAIGIVGGVLLLMSIAFWRECAIRRDQMHENEMRESED